MSAQNINCTPVAYRTPSAADDINARLNWLLAFDAAEERRRFLFRSAGEEEEAQLMRRPLSTERAYAFLGLLLGALPLAAVFFKVFDRMNSYFQMELFLLLVAMNLMGCVFGRFMGKAISVRVYELERASWHRMIVGTLLLGFVWGIVTGAASGVLLYGIGAFIVPFFTAPLGMVAFTLFTLLHRLLVRGDMIDARHFWPLACGITMFIAALVLNPRF